MLKDDEGVAKISIARLCPSWLVAVGLGLVVGLTLSVAQVGAINLVYILGLLAFVLVYLCSKIYNQFADYYNYNKFKDLEAELIVNQLISELDGTFQDETCLTHSEEETDGTKS